MLDLAGHGDQDCSYRARCAALAGGPRAEAARDLERGLLRLPEGEAEQPLVQAREAVLANVQRHVVRGGWSAFVDDRQGLGAGATLAQRCRLVGPRRLAGIEQVGLNPKRTGQDAAAGAHDGPIGLYDESG